jgi:hypothetical protein
VYKDRKKDEWHVSYGQNPKPFMYETLNKLAENAESDASKLMSFYLSGSL